MSEGLKPCPFCGGESCRVIGGPGTKGGPQFWAGCDYCNGRAWGDTHAEAVAAWNRRPLLSSPRVEEVRRLREALAPFALAFERARERYAKRYPDKDLGYSNFDKMPDSWPMDGIAFNMGAFRAVISALSPPVG